MTWTFYNALGQEKQAMRAPALVPQYARYQILHASLPANTYTYITPGSLLDSDMDSGAMSVVATGGGILADAPGIKVRDAGVYNVSLSARAPSGASQFKARIWLFDQVVFETDNTTTTGLQSAEFSMALKLGAGSILTVQYFCSITGAVTMGQLAISRFGAGPQGPSGANGSGVPPLLSALPVSPSDGDTIDFQNTAMAALGVVWRLRYRAAASGSYKWEFVGGSDMVAQDLGDNAITLAPATWTAWTPSLSLTLPLSGDYMADTTAAMNHTAAAANWHLGLNVGGVDPIVSAGVGEYVMQRQDIANRGANLRYTPRLIAMVAAAAIRPAYYYTDGASGSCKRFGASLRFHPIRVG